MKYVYIFLDPRKPGKFYYKEFNLTFLFEPFYVGKGKETRYKRHLNFSKLNNDGNLYKKNKLKAILNLGYDPLKYVVFIYNDLSEEEATIKEKEVINSIGRLDLETGPLTNLTIGGEGISGRISPFKGRTLAENIGKEAAERTCKINSERLKKNGISRTKEAKLKISIANGRPIKQMDLNCNLIKIWRSLTFAAKSLGIGVSTIFNCTLLRERSITGGGFKWEFVDCPNLKYTEEYQKRHKSNCGCYRIIKDDKILYCNNLKKFAEEKGLKRDSLASSYRFNRIYRGYKVERISLEEYKRETAVIN